MPRWRRYPQADARSQGGLCRDERIAAERLDFGSLRCAQRMGQLFQPYGELGDRQSADALAFGKDVRHRAGAKVAEICQPQLPAAGGAAETYPSYPSQRAKSAVLRRYLCELP